MTNDYQTIIHATLILGGIGAICAAILYLIARLFQVTEDPRLEEIESALPQANCGGCGYAGCKGFAKACITASSLDALVCPVGGAPIREQIATILGVKASAITPRVAVVRCSAHIREKQPVARYDGARSCAVETSLYSGESGCAYGCLGQGDCVEACPFGAIRMHPQTGLPEILEEKCTACGACVRKCPRSVIELKIKPGQGKLVYVQCVNKEKGAVARKTCPTACIGCAKCAKNCPQEAIVITNHLARIDENKCNRCGNCISGCPTGAIYGNRPDIPTGKVQPEHPQ